MLLVWLAWMLVDTIWLFLSGSPRIVSRDDSLPVLERTVAPSGNASGSLSLDRVSAWELFGPVQEQVATVVEAPETRLRLELLGVFQHPSDELASAIIAEQGKNGELYHVGDRLPGNATLERVYPDRVILMRAGRRETLRMKEPASSGSISLAPEPSVQAEAAPPVQEADAGAGPATDEAETGSPQAPALREQRARIVNQLGLTSSDEGGYRIGTAAPAQMLQAFGLQHDDVLVSVNGFHLGNEEADLAALQSFHETGTASIMVRRGDQTFTITYPP